MSDILELINKHGLASHQSQNLLERLGRNIEMGQRVAVLTICIVWCPEQLCAAFRGMSHCPGVGRWLEFLQITQGGPSG